MNRLKKFDIEILFLKIAISYVVYSLKKASLFEKVGYFSQEAPANNSKWLILFPLNLSNRKRNIKQRRCCPSLQIVDFYWCIIDSTLIIFGDNQWITDYHHMNYHDHWWTRISFNKTEVKQKIKNMK